MQFAGMRIKKTEQLLGFFAVLLCLLYFVGTSLKLALAFASPKLVDNYK